MEETREQSVLIYNIISKKGLDWGQSMDEHIANIRTYIKYRIYDILTLTVVSKVIPAIQNLSYNLHTIDNQCPKYEPLASKMLGYMPYSILKYAWH